jgi:hypothetical protein
MHSCNGIVKGKSCKDAVCVIGLQHVIIKKYGILTLSVSWGNLPEVIVLVLKKCNSEPGGMHVYIVITVHCTARKGYCIHTYTYM